MKFSEKLIDLKYREKPNLYSKLEATDGQLANHLTNIKKVKKYDYYICDYCGEEIIINKKWENKTGGICDIPVSLTHSTKLKLALHNKCINHVINEIMQKQMENKNYNHIPRID